MVRAAQPKREQDSAAQKFTPKKANATGIPDAVKTHFEDVSGFSFDDVRVHYNSDKPAQLQALAYTQGNQVYIGSGQEKHLGHELGHVAQQKAGAVKPTGRIGGVAVNEAPGLEKEADLMADRANEPVQMRRIATGQSSVQHSFNTRSKAGAAQTPQPLSDTDREFIRLYRKYSASSTTRSFLYPSSFTDKDDKTAELSRRQADSAGKVICPLCHKPILKTGGADIDHAPPLSSRFNDNPYTTKAERQADYNDMEQLRLTHCGCNRSKGGEPYNTEYVDLTICREIGMTYDEDHVAQL